MVTVISRFRVRNGMEEEVRSAFVNRPRRVESTAGFCGLDVMTDASDPSVFLLLTRWTDEASFRVWHRSDAHHLSHELMPRGLKLDATFTSLTVGNGIGNPEGAHYLNDALEGQTVALSKWLMDSELVLALLIRPDGAIRVRNRAAFRIFPPGGGSDTIWEYLDISDPGQLRQGLSEAQWRKASRIRANLAAGGRNPIMLEIEFVPCNGVILLLAAQVLPGDMNSPSGVPR